MRLLLLTITSMLLLGTAQAGQVDKETFFDDNPRRAMKKCQRARRSDYKCDSSSYRCTPCKQRPGSNHASYAVNRRSSYDDNDYGSGSYGRVTKKCVVFEIDRRRVEERYTARAKASTRSEAKRKACRKAMRACNNQKFYGNRCVKKSNYNGNHYGRYDLAIDVLDLFN